MTDKQNQRVTEIVTCIEIAAAATAESVRFVGADGAVFDEVYAQLEGVGSLHGEVQRDGDESWRQWHGYMGALSVGMSTPHMDAPSVHPRDTHLDDDGGPF